jgi:hypothetical protein
MRARTLARGLPTLFVLGALAAQAAPPKKHLLRYAFEEGKTAWSVVTQRVTMKTDMGGTKVEGTMDTQMFVSETVAEIKDGKARIVRAIERIKCATKRAGRELVYDSDVEGSDPGPLAAVADLIGKRKDVWMDARGSAGDLKLPDELKNAAIDFEQVAHQQWQMLPDEPVAVGATWETEVATPKGSVGEGKMKVKSKLIEVVGSKARIEWMQTDTDGIDVPGGGNLALKMRGTVTIDLAGLQIPEKTLETVITMKINGGEVHTETGMTTKATEPPKNAKPAKQPEAKEQGK